RPITTLSYPNSARARHGVRERRAPQYVFSAMAVTCRGQHAPSRLDLLQNTACVHYLGGPRNIRAHLRIRSQIGWPSEGAIAISAGAHKSGDACGTQCLPLAWSSFP